jgi:nitrite reductase (cytochrome c-552)
MRSRPWQRALRLAARVLLTLGAALVLSPAQAQAIKVAAPAKKVAAFDATACLMCHQPIKAFHDEGKHKGLACTSCHTGLDKHSEDRKQRPVTLTDPAVCGNCHKPQYETMYKMNFEKPARSEKSQANGVSPNPAWDKLMMPHGFTREHNLPRSHSFALYDQYVVDRAFGGRFSNSAGWQGLAQAGGSFKVQGAVTDADPASSDQKSFRPGTATAANPVCLSCKTQDHILDWAYMGDPQPQAKWSRSSKVVELARSVDHSLNCFFCHDPHSAKPRIVRDALIQAVTRPEKDTLWHSDPRGAKVEVKELGVRGFTRKIATLSRYDTNLQCGQCHVEYNCNPGTDPNTGAPITMADQRTNIFPFQKVDKIKAFYDDRNFYDFKHGITGANLWKGQHPDVEVYYGSKHQKAGVECSQCHMPKVKDARTGKIFTSHWQTSPNHYIKETCLTCHSDWKAEQANYVIESMKGRYNGKLRKAEFWLVRLIDKFEEAKNVGVDESVLGAARKSHENAHINWEFWTAANGAHFHNLDEATASLNKSMTFAQEGIKLLDDALAAKRKDGKGAAPVASAPSVNPAAVPAAVPAAPVVPVDKK